MGNEYPFEQLLGLVGAFIKVADGDLINKRSCFPCKPELHEYFKEIRDCYQQMYTEADYTHSIIFLNDVQGKPEKIREMKAKLFNDPVKRNNHREDLIEKLCNISTIEEAHSYINIEHHALYAKALKNIDKCSGA